MHLVHLANEFLIVNLNCCKQQTLLFNLLYDLLVLRPSTFCCSRISISQLSGLNICLASASGWLHRPQSRLSSFSAFTASASASICLEKYTLTIHHCTVVPAGFLLNRSNLLANVILTFTFAICYRPSVL